MYRAQRRIKCGAAVCSLVWTRMGVLAGRPVAMGALCLVLLSPMDQLMREVPTSLTTLRVHVDDFTVAHRVDGTFSIYIYIYMRQQTG